MLHQFAYISDQVQKFSEQDLKQLMVQARAKNKKMELTGLLLFDKGTFLQVLEGPADAIAEMTAIIQSDQRHESMDIIYTNDQLHEREFANWRMGLNILNESNPSDYQALDTRVKKLLNEAEPNGELAHQLLTQYTNLKNSYVNLNGPI